LANHNQEASATPVVLVHQHQQALIAIQALERQRLQPQTHLTHPQQVGAQLQQQQVAKKLSHKTISQ
jgi:hypothetical protein